MTTSFEYYRLESQRWSKIESIDHLKASLLAAPFATSFLSDPSSMFQFLLYSFSAAALGTLIDLDHYPVYRYIDGNWNALKKSIRKPTEVMRDYSMLTVFSAEMKYFAYSISITLVLVCIWFIFRDFFYVAAAILSLHLLMDL